MASTYRLEVVTPARIVFSEEVEMVIAPGIGGVIGILAHHAPMVVGLGVGELSYGEYFGRKEILAISGGFIEVGDNQVSVVADAAERPDEIDVARAESARERAERRLNEARSGGSWDTSRAELALARAMNRLRVAGKG